MRSSDNKKTPEELKKEKEDSSRKLEELDKLIRAESKYGASASGHFEEDELTQEQEREVWQKAEEKRIQAERQTAEEVAKIAAIEKIREEAKNRAAEILKNLDTKSELKNDKASEVKKVVAYIKSVRDQYKPIREKLEKKPLDRLSSEERELYDAIGAPPSDEQIEKIVNSDNYFSLLVSMSDKLEKLKAIESRIPVGEMKAEAKAEIEIEANVEIDKEEVKAAAPLSEENKLQREKLKAARARCEADMQVKGDELYRALNELATSQLDHSGVQSAGLFEIVTHFSKSDTRKKTRGQSEKDNRDEIKEVRIGNIADAKIDFNDCVALTLAELSELSEAERHHKLTTDIAILAESKNSLDQDMAELTKAGFTLSERLLQRNEIIDIAKQYKAMNDLDLILSDKRKSPHERLEKYQAVLMESKASIPQEEKKEKHEKDEVSDKIAACQTFKASLMKSILETANKHKFQFLGAKGNHIEFKNDEEKVKHLLKKSGITAPSSDTNNRIHQYTAKHSGFKHKLELFNIVDQVHNDLKDKISKGKNVESIINNNSQTLLKSPDYAAGRWLLAVAAWFVGKYNKAKSYLFSTKIKADAFVQQVDPTFHAKISNKRKNPDSPSDVGGAKRAKR